MRDTQFSGLEIFVLGVKLAFQDKAKISSDQKDEGWANTGLVQRAGSESCRSQIFGTTHVEILEPQLRHPPGKDHVVKPGKGSAIIELARAEISPGILMSAPDKPASKVEVLPSPSQGEAKAIKTVR